MKHAGGRAVAWIAAATAALWALGCAGGLGSTRLSARLESVELASLDAMAAELRVRVKVSSASGAGIMVNKAHVKVEAAEPDEAGTLHKVLVMDDDVVLDPAIEVSGARVIEVPVRLGVGALSGAAPSSWAKGRVDLAVSVTLMSGRLRADAGSGRATVSMVAPPLATLGELRFEGLGMDDPYLVVALVIHNENAGAAITVDDVVSTVTLDGVELVKNGHAKEKPTIAADGSATVRFEVPLDFAAHPAIEKRVRAGFGKLSIVVKGQVLVSTDGGGKASADYDLAGALELHR